MAQTETTETKDTADATNAADTDGARSTASGGRDGSSSDSGRGSSKSSVANRSDDDASAPRTIFPQFALDAADARIATWSTAIVDAADTIERLVASESLPVPDPIRDLATSTTQKLRSFGAQSGEYDAAELVSGLQRAAAAHPAASIGIGAAVGATLATLLVRLGSSGAKDERTSGASTNTGTGASKSGGSSASAGKSKKA